VEKWELLLEELREEITLRERELDLLHKIDLGLLADLPAEDIFGHIVRGTQDLLRSSHTTILMRRSTFLEPTYSNLTSVVGQLVPVSESITGLCLEADETINIPDITKSPHRDRYAPLRGYDGPPMHSLLATPIRIRDTPVGVLNAESTAAGAFSAVHERVAAAVAAQVAMALQRTQTLDSTVLFADVDKLIIGDDRADQPDGDREAILNADPIQIALERVMAALQRLEHVKHHRADIMFKRGETELEIVHSTDPENVGLLVPIRRSVSGRAIRERKTIIVGDVTKDEEYQLASESIRSEIAVPILFGGTIPIGVLNVESEEEDAFYGFYQVVLESFAEKIKTLLAFAKLRADVTEALEMRSANDLLVAVGDQASHMVHRVNNTVGAMRTRILEMQDRRAAGTLGTGGFLDESLAALLTLAERTLRMPEEVTEQLGQDGSSVDVNDCVRQALSKVEPGQTVRVEADLQDGIPALPLYSFDIVVQNLLQNALDAMPDGGTLTVSTSAVRHAKPVTGYVQLTVGDTGAGIPPEIASKVFDLKFTTKSERKRGEGLGLGLWWVRNFVRRAKGDITIRSEPGSGTEVYVKIPIGPADGPAPG
jgi:signal transduction histidine kinase